MFSSIFAEIKKIKENFEFVSREEREARKGGKGGEPIFRMVEAERVHSNLLCIIPASLILFLVEICGMIWTIANKIDFEYPFSRLYQFCSYALLRKNLKILIFL